MGATTWLIIAIVGFSLSGIALIATVILFIKMNIPAVIGDLSGKTVAREIKAMRDANASSGNKLHKSSHVNVERGELTGRVVETEKSMDLRQSLNVVQGDTNTTETLSMNVGEVNVEDCGATEILVEANQTEILSETNPTEILKETNQTEILNEESDSTERNEGTTVLSETAELKQEQVEPVTFKITRSIIEIHTEESI